MTGHAAPRWAAITIATIFLALLVELAGVFDAGWCPLLSAGRLRFLDHDRAGLRLAAGLRSLTDTIIAPVVSALLPYHAARRLKWAS